MGYFENIVKYLRKNNISKSLDSWAELLDIPTKPSENDLTKLLENRNVKTKIPSNIISDFIIAKELKYDTNPEWNNPISRGLIDLAVERGYGAYEDLITKIDRENYSKEILQQTGFDVKGLQKSKRVMKKQLQKWRKNNDYYVPLQDLFWAFNTESAEYKLKYYDPSRYAKSAIGALGVLGMELYRLIYAGLEKLGQKIRPNVQPPIPKSMDTAKYDFNNILNILYRGSGLGGLLDSFRERHTIAFVETGSSEFYIQDLLTAFSDKNMGLDDVVMNNESIKPSKIPKIPQESRDPIKYFYNKKFKPTVLDNILVPFDYRYVRGEGNVNVFEEATWNLDAVPMGEIVNLNLPEEFNKNIESFKSMNTSPLTIMYKFKREYLYGDPKLAAGKTRFESTALFKKGVCQDVNFLFLYTLRKMGIPSFMALGYLQEEDKIIAPGHAVVIAKYDKEWEIYDATPTKKEEDYDSNKDRPEKHKPFKPKKQKNYHFFNGVGKLYRSFRKEYNEIKESARRKAIDLEKRIYKDLLTNLDEQLNATTQIVVSQISTISPTSDNYAKIVATTTEDLSKINVIRNIGLENISNIPRKYNFDTKRDLKPQNVSVRVNGLFKPKQVREALKQLKYYELAYPDYVQRVNMFNVSKDYYNEVLRTQGKLIPFHSRQNGDWTKLIDYMFFIAGKTEVPPSPLNVSAPERVYFDVKPKLDVRDPENGREYRIKKPKWIQPQRSDDKRVFSVKDEGAALDITDEQLKTEIYNILPFEEQWYKREMEQVEYPDQRRYTHAAEILKFDKEYSEKNKFYWHFISEFLKSNIKAGEYTASVVFQKLTQAVQEYDNQVKRNHKDPYDVAYRLHSKFIEF